MSDWTGKYTWKLENCSQYGAGDNTKSPEFEIGGHTWNLLVYPFGNSADETETRHMSLYLELSHASSTPVAKCPNVFFEAVIVNQLDSEKSFNGIGRHFYTSHSPNWGFLNTIPTSDLETPDSGFVVDDRLTFEVMILVIEDDSTPNSKLVTLQGSPVSQSKEQELIFLNVGGQPFKMTRSTVERFPESLLCKMVEEFPELVEKREELYIDRNPKAFPWIHEIYRDGDFQHTLPDMPFERLEKELDFYQLPLVEELGIKQKPGSDSEDGVQVPMVKLFYEIMAEIKACNQCDLSSFSVFVYYRKVANRKEGMRRVFVLPPDSFMCTQCINDRGHETFDKAIHAAPKEVTGTNSTGSTMIRHPASGEKFRVVNIANDKLIELLNGEASKFGMTVSRDTFTRETAEKQVEIGFLKIEYS